MKAIRLRISQNFAHYKKPECVQNKMTYPLPPPSTIIGAMHNICDYTSYHPMDVAIQGDFDSLQKRVYTDHCFLNSFQDDRGIMVHLKNPQSFSKAYTIVAKAIKPQGNSFEKEITIDVKNRELLTQYQGLKSKKRKFAEEKKLMKETLKQEKAIVKEKKNQLKMFKKESVDESQIKLLEEEIKSKVECIKFKEETFKLREKLEVDEPLEHYQTLTTSVKSYELLTEVKLTVYIMSDESVLSDIMNNINKFTSLGRMEDFIHLESIDYVQLDKTSERFIFNQTPMYFNSEHLHTDEISAESDVTLKNGTTINSQGTKFYLNKNYKIIKNQRIFNKTKAVYLESISIEAETEMDKLYYDHDLDPPAVVSFL